VGQLLTSAEQCQQCITCASLKGIECAIQRDEEGKRKDYAVVDVEESLWSLDDEEVAGGQAIKLLMITLVKPPLSEDEVMWKKGQRL